ncbi:MAG: triose-phosphate isomerase [Pseudomonadota bacterium]
MARTVIAGNWKMNGLLAAIAEIEAVVAGLPGRHTDADILICPPATLITAAAQAAGGSSLSIGAQDVHAAESGAHTGDLSCAMLSEAGASHVIVGHSERRADHGETSADVAAKAEAAQGSGLIPIICVGETLDEREAGRTLDIIAAQLDTSIPDTAPGAPFIVAYEPVWAIGTGKVAGTEQIAEVHDFIRSRLTERFGAPGSTTPILYGGSMKPGNAADILAVAHVNGGLIGGASLKATDFLAIYDAAKAQS